MSQNPAFLYYSRALKFASRRLVYYSVSLTRLRTRNVATRQRTASAANQARCRRLESCTTSQQIGDERNCTVSTLRTEPVSLSFKTISLRGGADKKQDTSREISRHFVVDSN